MVEKLEAVNTMLRVIGQVPVKIIPESGLSDASIASEVLEEMSVELQSEGYSFNEDKDVEFATNSSGFIPLSETFIHISSYLPRYRYAMRRNGSDSVFFVYDLDEKTYQFDSPVRLNVIRQTEFRNLPSLFQRYVIIRAARVFAHRTLGNQEIDGYNAEDEIRAKTTWLNSVARNEELNLFSSSSSHRPQTFSPYNSLARF